MFFITKDGIKDWKEGDAWYKPSSVEGYEATSSPSTGMSPVLKGFLIAFGIIAGLCLLGFVLKFVAKRMHDKELK